ncbi:MAG: Acyl-CoA dehydrogenase, partial [uncultured Acetobacteraceae bacterium]
GHGCQRLLARRRLGRAAYRAQRGARNVPRRGAALLRAARRAAPPAVGAGRHRAALLVAGGRGAGAAVPDAGGGARRRGRGFRAFRRDHRGDRVLQRQRRRLPAAFGHRGALHRRPRHAGAQARVAAADGAGRADRRHRHDRAGHGERPQSVADHGQEGRRPLRHRRVEDVHQQRAERGAGHRGGEDRSGGGAEGHQPDLRRGRHAGVLARAQLGEDRAARAGHVGAVLRRGAGAGGEPSRRGEPRLLLPDPQPAAGAAGDRRARRHRHGGDAGAYGGLRKGAAGLRAAGDRLPAQPIQAGGGQGAGGDVPRVRRPLPGAAPARRADGGAGGGGEAAGRGDAEPAVRRLPPAPRRLRLHGGVRDRPRLGGRARGAHLRRFERDHEGDHRAHPL